MYSLEDDFDINRKRVGNNQNFDDLNNIILEIRQFIESFAYLSFGKDTVFLRKGKIINPNRILDSVARTVESIRFCCLNCNFADAYTLLRKYRDDLFYYLFLFAVTEKNFEDFIKAEDYNKNEKHILDWMNNRQKDLHIGDVLTSIANNSRVKRAICDFNLKESFDELSNRLNDHVHSNGQKFYNESYENMQYKCAVEENCIKYGDEILFITVTFIFIATLIKPILIMSDDYTDYLDCGELPEEESQYWVAPFVSDFFLKHKNILSENCSEYLRKKTKMKI